MKTLPQAGLIWERPRTTPDTRLPLVRSSVPQAGRSGWSRAWDRVNAGLQTGLVLAGMAGLAGVAGFGRTANGQAARTAAGAGNAQEQRASDVFNSMVASAASFDMDSPVETKAEFDPPVARAGGQIIYRVIVTALDESLKVPDNLPVPDGLKLQPGGRGQIYQPSGGMKIRPQTTINYHVSVATNGDYTIPAFNVMAYGKPVEVPAATLKVTGEALPREAPRLFMLLPAGDVFVGQALSVPLALTMPPDGSMGGTSQPRVTGDLVFSEQMFSSGLRQENILHEGRNFPAFVQDVSVTPLREGPLEIIGQAYAMVPRPIPGLTNVFQNVTELVDSGPVILMVKPLPTEGQLPGFMGAVGVFHLDPPRLSTNVVRAGEPLTLTVVIHGSGNLGRLTPPSPPALRDWQSFPPIGETVPPAFIQQRGYTVFTYTLIPLSDHIWATPAIPFSYFDPRKKTYVDVTIPPVALTVKPSPSGAVAQARMASTLANQDDDDSPSREREPVLTGLAETPGGAGASLIPVQRRAWFWGLQLLLAAGLSGLWALDRWRRHMEEHPEITLRRRARRGMGRQLRLARRAASARDAAGFASSAANALREACAPHGAANPSALVCADVLQELPEPEREGRAGEMVRKLFAAADALRFGGPVKEGPELLSLKPELEQVLEEMRGRL